MRVQINKTVEELVKSIGQYQERNIRMALSPTNPPDLIERTSRLLSSFLKDNENLIISPSFKDYNWSQLLQKQIGECYGHLVSIQNHELLLPIPSQIQEVFDDEFGRYIGEAISNAVRHGNKFSLEKKTYLDSYLGEKGIVWCVRDEGEGFDVQAVIDKYNRGDKSYCSAESHGGGFITWMGPTHFIEPVGVPSELIFAFNDKGNQWMFLYEFEKNRYRPEAKVLNQ